MYLASMDKFDYDDKFVLLRLDINSPIDPITKKIANENRIQKSLPTLKKLISKNAKVAILAHQGDTMDYQNLMPLSEHAEKLTQYLGREVKYIDDVCGPAAQDAVRNLKAGEMIILGNARYLTEEVSIFEKEVKLTQEQMNNTYMIRKLAPLFDYYVNDAFSGAHRGHPSFVGFQELLPTAAGELLLKEVTALDSVMENPEQPCIFVLGGAKISDAFAMMRQVLENGTADKILTCGITGEVMLLAKGIRLGEKKEQFIRDKNLDIFIDEAAEYLKDYPGKIEMPVDLAYSSDGKRQEVDVIDLPLEEMFMDIGNKTVIKYSDLISSGRTIFVNGPAGVYEDQVFEKGTRGVFEAIAESRGYSVIGGGDTVSAAQGFIDTEKIDYVSTAGGALIAYLSGDELPLMKAMKRAAEKWHS